MIALLQIMRGVMMVPCPAPWCVVWAIWWSRYLILFLSMQPLDSSFFLSAFLSFPVLFFVSSHFLSFSLLSSRLSDECVQSGRAGSMQSIWLAGGGCHYSPVSIDTKRERIKDFKHAYLAMSLTAMFLVCFFSSSSSSPPSSPCF